jgi:uncharacterized protein YyaL (SSP411 family)
MGRAESPKSSRKPNRLIEQKSPYLLQHAYNPVDWYPWGDEAFEKAREKDRPILLSIGYSTCHWCHVMAHESFEDQEVAELLNEVFVAIKVDREERPDLDSIYMTVCQMLTGGGGWPLTVIMTPDKKPFFAGTYFPKRTRFGQTGMLELASRVRDVWSSRREEASASAEEIALALRQVSEHPPGEGLDETTLNRAYTDLSVRFDRKHSGFGTAPKFPAPHNLLFLLRYWKRTGEARALEMVERTLTSMAASGIYDHIGLGFHRYSTDAEWLVPHFEKMLYDQALLVMAYAEAYQATGKTEYELVARRVLEYVEREMTSRDGGFYSAQDADSEGEEGKFYLWTLGEIREAVGKEDADLIASVFGVLEEGNFVEQTTGRKIGANILHLGRNLEGTASELGTTALELEKRLDSARAKLFAAREKRMRPRTDDKILADWNGLMIAGLAIASRVFAEPAYERAARRAADFILSRMVTPGGRLLHRYRDGDATVHGMLDDYAFMVWGLLELYQADFGVGYLEGALGFATQMVERFWDGDEGGFYFTPDDGEKLLARKKEVYDGATPSGNSVAMMDLVRLGRMTADSELEKKASKLAWAFSGTVAQAPSAHAYLVAALDFALGPSYEVVIVGRRDAPDTEAMLEALRRHYIPGMVVLFKSDSERSPAIARLAGFTEPQVATEGRATAYVCRSHSCDVPTTDPAEMLKLLGIKRA